MAFNPVQGLQKSGQISLGDVAEEFQDSLDAKISEFYGVDINVPKSGRLKLSDFYGATRLYVIPSSELELSSTSKYNTGFDVLGKAKNIGWNGFSKLEVTISQNLYSDSTAANSCALRITDKNSGAFPQQVTIKISGVIMGRGGRGAHNFSGAQAGRTAIIVDTRNSKSAYGNDPVVKIQLFNNGTVLGGGGGGGGMRNVGTYYGAGGGGAGGGPGGNVYSTGDNLQYGGGGGGGFNARGGTGGGSGGYGGRGGGAGGGGGGHRGLKGRDNAGAGGGGGRRWKESQATGGAGGSNGGAKGGSWVSVGSNGEGCGGGGYGARGGNGGYSGAGGAGAVTVVNGSTKVTKLNNGLGFNGKNS